MVWILERRTALLLIFIRLYLQHVTFLIAMHCTISIEESWLRKETLDRKKSIWINRIQVDVQVLKHIHEAQTKRQTQLEVHHTFLRQDQIIFYFMSGERSFQNRPSVVRDICHSYAHIDVVTHSFRRGEKKRRQKWEARKVAWGWGL